MVGCLLAGCAAQPTTSTPSSAAPAVAGAPVCGGMAPTTDPSHWPPSPFVLRLGVEHLPPTLDAQGDVPAPRLESTARQRPPERLLISGPEPNDQSSVERKLL